MKAKMLSAALFAALVLSAAQSVRADETTYNYWEGGAGDSWTDTDSETGKYKWTTGELPTATETAAFKQGAQTVKIKDGKCLAAKVVFESGSVITFSRLDSGKVDAVTAGEFSGEGTLKLLRTGLKAAYAGCTVSVAGFEVLHDNSYPSNYSWLDGGTAESEKMVVESAVTGSGNLACNNYVEVNGDVTLTGSLKLSANATVKNLVYDNGGCKIASDSAGGTIEKVTVKSGTLEYSSSTLKSVSAITVGKFVLDGGTLSVASDFSGTIAVAEGGGTLFLEGEWNGDASVSLPAGLSFAEGADLSKVTVQATIGESTSPATFAIAHENETYSLEYVGYTYNLEDLDLSWMTSGWSTPKKNKAVGGGDLQLWDGTEWQKYERGIGTHADSSFFINLGGNGVAFTALVGIDKESNGQTASNGTTHFEVNFIVRDVIGRTNLVESGVVEAGDVRSAAKMLSADLAGIELIELVVDSLGDNSFDHADWVNPTIVMKGDAAPVTKGPNHWVGRGTDTNWDTADNWEFGVPREDATIVFDSDAEVRMFGDKTVARVVVNDNATVKFRTTNFWGWEGAYDDVYPSLCVQEVSGGGKIQLWQAGICADYTSSDIVQVDVDEIEALEVYQDYNHHDSWLQGGDEEGKRMLVNSHITIAGKLRVYGNTTINGDIEFAGNGNRSFALESSNGIAKNVVWNGNNPVFTDKHVGTVEKYTIIGGSCSYSTGFPAIFIDGGTVDIGDGSSIEGGGLEIGVLSGGYLRYTVSELPASGVPTFPANVTFPDSADLTTIFAVVKNASGDAQKTYAITKTGEVYSFAAVVPTDTVKWIGGVDNNWQTAGNWIYGAVPTEGQSVLFERSADVGINQDVRLPKIATLTVESGARVALRYNYNGAAGNYWTDGGGKPVVPFVKITGGGTLVLQHVGLDGSAGDEGARIDVARIEVEPFQLNDEYRDTYISGPAGGTPFSIAADVSGGGYLHMNNRLALSGDNSGFAGHVVFSSSDADGKTDRYFNAPESFFPNASTFKFYGRAFIGFTEGTARLGNVTMGESYGAAFVVKYGAEVTLEVESGSIRDTYFGNGFEVRTCAQDSEGYDNSTAGCANLTIKKVGEGTLVYGVTKQHNLVVAEGRVEFTGENDNGDDADVNVTVKNGASIGSAASMTSGSGTAIGGDVTVRHQFAFEPGAAIKQEYIATTTTDEQTQEETTTYSMRKLTIADDVDLANVVFGVTNPEDLPAVTKALVLDGTQRFTMFAANALSGAVATENGGYTPTGSEKNCKWLFRTKRNSVNEVEFYPFQKLGFAVIVR